MHFIFCVDVFHRILVVFWDVTPVMHLHSIWLHNQQQRRRRRCNIKVGEVIISVSRRSCQHAARAHEWSGDIGLSCTTTSSTCPAAVRRPRGDGTVTRTCLGTAQYGTNATMTWATRIGFGWVGDLLINLFIYHRHNTRSTSIKIIKIITRKNTETTHIINHHADFLSSQKWSANILLQYHAVTSSVPKWTTHDHTPLE